MILTNKFGMVDGTGQQASFNRPQAMYFDSTTKDLIIINNQFFSTRKMNQSGLLLLFVKPIQASKGKNIYLLLLLLLLLCDFNTK